MGFRRYRGLWAGGFLLLFVFSYGQATLAVNPCLLHGRPKAHGSASDLSSNGRTCLCFPAIALLPAGAGFPLFSLTFERLPGSVLGHIPRRLALEIFHPPRVSSLS
jgi:hypothetical protein